MSQYLLLLLTTVVLQLFGLSFAVWSNPFIQRKRRRIMLIIIALIASLLVQNLVDFQLQRVSLPLGRTLTAIFGYSVRPLIELLFFYIVSDRKSHRAGWLLVGLNALIHLTALFSPICFSIDANNLFHRGPLGYTCHIVSALLLIQLVWVTVREFGESKKQELWLPILNALVIIASVLLDSFADYHEFPLSFLSIAIVNTSMFYYIWLHLQFVRRHEQTLLAEQRIQIMMSQIQPHFLYNTLATISALCRREPEAAARMIERLSAYLRQNLDSLGQPECIPFAKELEHTRIYTDIEQVRFDTIRVEYDVGDRDFSLPPLTLQPLVENAIRHGVRIREQGLVRIETRRSGAWHEIVIRDNGVGFDVNALETLDDDHIGIRNVRERLKKMCGGTLTIDSRIGEGTTAVIRIPAAG